MITVDDVMKAARRLEGRDIKTAGGRTTFRVELYGRGLRYIPLSKRPRNSPSKKLDEVVEHFNRTGSFNPSHYQDITFNSSYTLALIRHIQSGGK